MASSYYISLSERLLCWQYGEARLEGVKVGDRMINQQVTAEIQAGKDESLVWQCRENGAYWGGTCKTELAQLNDLLDTKGEKEL